MKQSMANQTPMRAVPRLDTGTLGFCISILIDGDATPDARRIYPDRVSVVARRSCLGAEHVTPWRPVTRWVAKAIRLLT